jgi:NTP pyrophosphatase (non-canonical NTP hydrolase)
MTDEQRAVCLRAINHFGTKHQKGKLIEELAELTVEITREQDGRTDKGKIREELADVIIMCEQMRIIFGAAAVDREIARKLERLKNTILGGNANG